jgi:hypothetical protein
MKKIFLIIIATLGITVVFGQVRLDQNMVQLATQYYNARDFEKAAPLFKDIYQISNNRHYFRLFISSLQKSSNIRKLKKRSEKRYAVTATRNPTCWCTGDNC